MDRADYSKHFSDFSEAEDDSMKVKFPKKPDALLPRESQTMDERRKQLEAYLQSLVRNEEFRNHKDLVSRHHSSHLHQLTLSIVPITSKKDVNNPIFLQKHYCRDDARIECLKPRNRLK